jgi:hypothetical protein
MYYAFMLIGIIYILVIAIQILAGASAARQTGATDGKATEESGLMAGFRNAADEGSLAR